MVEGVQVAHSGMTQERIDEIKARACTFAHCLDLGHRDISDLLAHIEQQDKRIAELEDPDEGPGTWCNECGRGSL